MKMVNYIVAILIISQHLEIFGSEFKETKNDGLTHTAVVKKSSRLNPLTSQQGLSYCAAKRVETLVCAAAKKSKIGYASVDSVHEFSTNNTHETLCLKLPTNYGQYFSVCLPFGTFNFASLITHEFPEEQRAKLLKILSKKITFAEKLEKEEAYPITKISGVTITNTSAPSYISELSSAGDLWNQLDTRYHERESSRCTKRCSNSIVRLLYCCRSCCSCCRCSKCCSEAMPIN